MRDPLAHELLIQWRQARAIRVGQIFGVVGFLLAGLTTLADVIWANYVLLPTDFILMWGCAQTLIWVRAPQPPQYFWKPIYFSYFVASLPTYWITGGLSSPFFGIGIALLYATGEILDARGRSRFHLAFALLHIPAFIVAEYLHPLASPPPLPLAFTALVTAANLCGVFVCFRSFLHTEEELSLKFSERQAQLAEAGTLLERRVEERTLQLEQSLEREIAAKELAEKASQAKMQFLANMSHEIRTPLGAVLGFAEILAEERSPEKINEFITRIRTNGTQLLRLVDDILDLSKFEAGKIPIQKSAVDVKALIRETANSFQPALRAKKLRLDLCIDKSVPSELVIDETRTSQVFGNLLNNAIKFSDSGTIKVSVQARDNRLALSVEDMGIGISPMDQKNLFQMFSQADSSIARRFGGSGLGLALSKRISEAMGGTLELMWSVPGKGSHFQFQVPFDVPHALRPASCESSPNRRPAGRGSTTHHVLLAEDSPDNVFLICHLIEPLGYRIDVATDGLAAVEAALQKHYDFILMDIQMPRMDGLEATRQIRAHGFKNPIIALTAHALRSEAERSLAAGCNRHLTKPVSRAELIEVLSDTRAHAP